MGRRFYEFARCAAVAAAALCAACDRPAPPAPAAPAATVDARAADAASRAVEGYLAADKPAEALKVAEKFAQEAPGLMRAQELHARALVAVALHPDMTSDDRAAFLGRAADAYGRAAAIDPSNAALRHAAGVVCDTAGRHADAVTHYEAAHRSDAANPQYAMYLGLACARAGRADEARSLLQDAARAIPDSPEPRAALADLSLRAGDLAAARAHIAEARRLDPTSIPYRVADARMHRLADDPRGSLELLMPLDAKVRRDPGVAEEIAAAFTAVGALREAAAILDDSATAAPNDWKRALRAARAWMRAGDPVKATVWSDAAALVGAPAQDVREAMAPVNEAPAPRPGGSSSP
jgi:tetratricopeptide (TPR) repeat protein